MSYVKPCDTIAMRVYSDLVRHSDSLVSEYHALLALGQHHTRKGKLYREADQEDLVYEKMLNMMYER